MFFRGSLLNSFFLLTEQKKSCGREKSYKENVCTTVRKFKYGMFFRRSLLRHSFFLTQEKSIKMLLNQYFFIRMLLGRKKIY